jgi:hypothetical protein
MSSIDLIKRVTKRHKGRNDAMNTECNRSIDPDKYPQVITKSINMYPCINCFILFHC